VNLPYSCLDATAEPAACTFFHVFYTCRLGKREDLEQTKHFEQFAAVGLCVRVKKVIKRRDSRVRVERQLLYLPRILFLDENHIEHQKNEASLAHCNESFVQKFQVWPFWGTLKNSWHREGKIVDC
jgi:hypothetical protein